ncbi:MAG: ABC transporter ATP-binding protein [Cyclobacteriaceae bacterium]
MELQIRNLSKTYANGVKALNDISLDIPVGMFGLLGPNGAGKSSLMRTIATLQEPDSGSITLGNLDILTEKEEVRKILGYLPQEFGVYPRVNAETLLDHLAVLKGILNKGERKELVKYLLMKTNLYDYRKRSVAGYSGGMKQRFGIAQALLSDPKLIIVDEPTAGLDPAERNRFLNLLSEIGENTVIILSTHIVEDVRELCTNMAIINQGSLLYSGTPDEAIRSVDGKIWRKSLRREELEEIKAQHQVISERRLAGKPTVHVYSDSQPADGFTAVHADLEDVYFSEMSNNEKELI